MFICFTFFFLSFWVLFWFWNYIYFEGFLCFGVLKDFLWFRGDLFGAFHVLFEGMFLYFCQVFLRNSG